MQTRLATVDVAVYVVDKKVVVVVIQKTKNLAFLIWSRLLSDSSLLSIIELKEKR